MNESIEMKKLKETLRVAIQIADNAVRADIECHAAEVIDGDGNRLFNVNEAVQEGVDMQIIRQAVAYIDLRGDVFPWRMKRRIDAQHLVQFVDKETPYGH